MSSFLTPQEYAMLEMLIGGKTPEDIASYIDEEPETIQGVLKRVLERLESAGYEGDVECEWAVSFLQVSDGDRVMGPPSPAQGWHLNWSEQHDGIVTITWSRRAPLMDIPDTIEGIGND